MAAQLVSGTYSVARETTIRTDHHPLTAPITTRPTTFATDAVSILAGVASGGVLAAGLASFTLGVLVTTGLAGSMSVAAGWMLITFFLTWLVLGLLWRNVHINFGVAFRLSLLLMTLGYVQVLVQILLALW